MRTSHVLYLAASTVLAVLLATIWWAFVGEAAILTRFGLAEAGAGARWAFVGLATGFSAVVISAAAATATGLVRERESAHAALREANDCLERRVRERTAALEREIAGRRRFERDLCEKEAALAQAQRLAKVGSWRWSIERDELISCSEECAHIHGVAPKEMPERMRLGIERRVHPDDRDRVAATFRKTAEAGVGYEIEYRLVLPDGGIRHVLELAEPVFDEAGRVVEHTGTLQDITERKANEEALLVAQHEAELANRAKSEFLANMSHELRTPLNAVIGFAELIGGERLGPIGNAKYAEYAQDIVASGQHLLSLINDVLDLSKIESGQAELREENIDLSAAVRTCAKLMRNRAYESGVDLIAQVGGETLPLLRADPRMVKQILVNLLSNAVKFTRPGGRVTIRAWCNAQSGHVLQVADTGIGMALEDIPKAMSRFGQVDSDLARRYEGTGLGLPLTKYLVELHGGRFDLRSEPGIGTTATAHFPPQRVVLPPQASRSPAA